MTQRAIQAEELWPGMPVYWLHTPRGGWNIPYEVSAVVVSWTPRRVTIEAERKDGSVKRVRVKLSSLRHRETRD